MKTEQSIREWLDKATKNLENEERQTKDLIPATEIDALNLKQYLQLRRIEVVILREVLD